jgi:hypothetical protein
MRIIKRGKAWIVVDAAGNEHGTHRTKRGAQRQVHAVYANADRVNNPDELAAVNRALASRGLRAEVDSAGDVVIVDVAPIVGAPAVLREKESRTVEMLAPVEVLSNPKPPTYEEAHWGLPSHGSSSLDVGDPRRNRKLVSYGALVSVVYLTKKGDDPALTEYEHKFKGPLPLLAFGSKDGKLYIAGGGYVCEDRGIVG